MHSLQYSVICFGSWRWMCTVTKLLLSECIYLFRKDKKILEIMYLTISDPFLNICKCDLHAHSHIHSHTHTNMHTFTYIYIKTHNLLYSNSILPQDFLFYSLNKSLRSIDVCAEKPNIFLVSCFISSSSL